ncbi:DeoR/GlpR family DNA-binding transcription regulator [Rodentibacter caecimuris]|uniref:DeoR family transcriptional regulator n=1 Tax=Rodentibacter caecimuris TaxID=1796644 RepID=A0ABX3KX76_9PAST|nr:DeoR family transcriptional regulator [Rodentibacter heylii]
MYKREELILQKVNDLGSVSVSQLAQEYAMSVETIRRDLNKLEKQGKLYRTHGGAISKKSKDVGAYFHTRQHLNVRAKKHNAKSAVDLVYENAVIGLDASSSSWHFSNLMPDIPCTVITNSMHNINALVNKPNIKTIVTGGVYSAKYEAFYGPLSEYLLQRLHINFCIFSCNGIDNEGNIWESNEVNASIKRKLMSVSEHNYLLVDHSKFNKKSLVKLAELSQIRTLFTNQLPSQSLQDYCTKHSVLITV